MLPQLLEFKMHLISATRVPRRARANLRAHLSPGQESTADQTRETPIAGGRDQGLSPGAGLIWCRRAVGAAESNEPSNPRAIRIVP